MTAAAPTLAREKPLLRGVSHQFAFFAALAAALLLVHRASGRAEIVVASIFGASLANLLGTSALYHRVDWSEAARQRMRRLDHAAIFLLIAGGYTPLLALVPSPSGGHAGLAMMWIGAALGVVKSLVWVRAPKWLTALLAVGLGWLAVGEVLSRTAAVGPLCIGVLVASGTIYSLGALVYALKRPDPLPRVFGYHEVFHALVVVASVCLYAHVWLVLAAVGAR
ncbi:MAG TPA: hemolysin III family protein [Minicystis sp.]|nr:hemolysin III family protein [Minicystis sp.]